MHHCIVEGATACHLCTTPHRSLAHRRGTKGPIDPLAATGSTRLVADLVLVLSIGPGKTSRQSKVMLARARRGGKFELLTAWAWAGALGYRPQ